MAQGLRRSAFDQSAYQYWAGQFGMANVKDYGAVGDGVHDDTSAIQAALDSLAPGAHAVIYLPAGTYLISSSLSLPTFPHAIVGSGRDTSILKATASMSAMLGGSNVTKSLFYGFYMNCNSVAEYGLSLTLSPEGSAQNRLEWLGGEEATEFLYNLVGTEDTVISQCSSAGDESDPSTIAPALNVQVPSGAIYLSGCALFGKCQFSYQFLSVTSSTMGPVYIVNSSGNSLSVGNFAGCYLYDGANPAISTGTSLTNLLLDSCYIISQRNATFINGNVPAQVTITAKNCEFIVGSLNSNTTVVAVQASGNGIVLMENCLGGNAPSGTTFNAFSPVGTTSPVPSMRNVTGMVLPSQIIAPPASPLVSGTIYQNISGVAMTIYQPVYASASGTAGSVAVALGNTDTPSTLYTQFISGSATASSPNVCTLRVPAGWYYSFTTSGATLADAQMVGE